MSVLSLLLTHERTHIHPSGLFLNHFFGRYTLFWVSWHENLETQVRFAEFNNTADNRANIGGTIIGAPIVGQ